LPFFTHPYFSGGQAKVSGSVSKLRGFIHQPPNDYRSLVIIVLEITPIISGLAGLKVASASKEGSETQASQDYQFSVLPGKKKQGEGN